MNSGFALFEILLTNAGPSAWIDMIPVFIGIALYLPVAYINYANAGYYTYSFLDPSISHGLLAAYIVGIGAATIIIFIIVRGICVLRHRLFRGRGLYTEGGYTHEEIDEWQDVDRAQVPVNPMQVPVDPEMQVPVDPEMQERERKESDPASTAGASSAV